MPLWKLLGEKKRDKIRVYCDTTSTTDIKAYERRLALRKKQGFTFFKMDLQTSLVREREGAFGPDGQLTDKGLAYLSEFMAMARGVIGKEFPLASRPLRAPDHSGRDPAGQGDGALQHGLGRGHGLLDRTGGP